MDDPDTNNENDIIDEEAGQVIKIELPPKILDHDYDEKPQQQADITTSDDLIQRNEKLIFEDKSELMDYITKTLSVDELLEKLTQHEETSNKRNEFITKAVKSIGIENLVQEFFPPAQSPSMKLTANQNAMVTGIVSEISKLMQVNSNAKHRVFDILSKQHSKDLLEYVIQEHSPRELCDKVSMPSIIKYLIHKANVSECDEPDALTNEMNRSLLYRLISDTHKCDKEIVEDSDEILELMKLLFKNKPAVATLDIAHEFLRQIVQDQADS